MRIEVMSYVSINSVGFILIMCPNVHSCWIFFAVVYNSLYRTAERMYSGINILGRI